MSLTGSAAILAVCLARLALRRAPAWLPCALWAVVLVRLLCPVGLPLLPEAAGTAGPLAAWADDYLGPTNAYHDNTPEYRRAVEAGRVPVQQESGGRYVVTAPDGVSEPATVGGRVFPVLGGVWLAGMAGMLLSGAAHWLRLRRRLTGCVRLRENIWLADRIGGPFVMGVARPRIYLPSWLEEPARGLVLRHERQHIRQLDHLTRLLAWAALCAHWFNPLVWLAFSLSGRDMEIRCDENATRGLSPALRADYAAALLRFAAQRRPVSPSPAFSEGDAGARIRRLARWKRPAAWAVGLAAALCAALAVALLADPAPAPPASTAPPLVSPPPGSVSADPQSAPQTPADDPPAPGYVSGLTLRELMAECGFAADAEPYARWPGEDEPELTLWFDPDRGVGCGALYTDGSSTLFRFDQTGPCWYGNAIDCWPSDPFDPACTLAPEPETTVRDYQETTDRDQAGRIVRWAAAGFLEEAGETVTVRSDDYTYREDGTLACRDYFHNDRLFGTWFFRCRLWYDGQQRLTRASGYATHGRTDYFYLYGENDTPDWQLCLDDNGGLLAAWMSPLS